MSRGSDAASTADSGTSTGPPRREAARRAGDVVGSSSSSIASKYSRDPAEAFCAVSTIQLIIIAGCRAMATSWMSSTMSPRVKSPWSVRRKSMT